MAKRLFIGNLPFSMTNEELKKLFSEYGEVTEGEIVINKFSGRSKGFGFLTMADDAQAEKAVAELNGKDVQGRKLTVNEAKPFNPDERPPRRERSFGGERRGGFGGSRGGGFGGERRSFGRRRDF